MAPQVSVISGKFRQENITKALKLIEDDIRQKITRKKRVVIKPNLGFIHSTLANTQAEAVEALLEFLRQFYQPKITIAEGTTIGETSDGFRQYGYNKLVEKFNVKLVDLNKDSYQDIEIYDGRLNPTVTVGLSETILKSDFIISICPIKTHDSVIVTLGIKNLAVGAICRPDRNKIHTGPKAINLTLAKIAPKVWPDLTVLDGFEAMEGDGPVDGEKVNFQVVVAGCDALATDTLTTILMGFKPSEVGYLTYLKDKNLGCGDPLRIAVRGDNWRKLIRRFKPHHLYQQQLDWQI